MTAQTAASGRTPHQLLPASIVLPASTVLSYDNVVVGCSVLLFGDDHALTLAAAAAHTGVLVSAQQVCPVRARSAGVSSQSPDSRCVQSEPKKVGGVQGVVQGCGR